MERKTPLRHARDVADTALAPGREPTSLDTRNSAPVSTLQRVAASAPPSKGITVALAHERYTFVAVSSDTHEAYTILKIVTDPGAGQPLHVHRREDEAWMVLEGTYAIRVGNRTRTLGPGTFVVAPKCVPHAYTNIGSTPGVLLCTIWPAGRFERLLMELGHMASDVNDSPPSDDLAETRAFAHAAPKYGIEVVAETTSPLMAGDGFNEPGEQAVRSN